MTRRSVRLGTALAWIARAVWACGAFLLLYCLWIVQEAALRRAAVSAPDVVLAVLGAIAGALMMAGVHVLGHLAKLHVLRPLEQLARALADVQRGAAGAKPRVDTAVEELARLAAGVEAVAEALRQRDETLRRENERSREAYATMLSALEDTSALADELRASEARYRVLMDMLPAMVWTAQPDGELNYFNRRWYDYTGLDEALSVGSGWASVVHSEDLPRALEAWRRALATGQGYEQEVRLRRASDGTFRWALVRAEPVRDTEGGVLRWIAAATDIEDQKEAAILQRAKSELEELDRLKDRFLGILSHELRTPINAIMGFGSVLDDEVVGPLTPEQHRYVKKILGGADLLLGLVNDLLDMSRIQAGKFSLAPARLALRPVVANTLESLAPLAEQKQVSLACTVPAELPPVRADEQRVTQVLINLVNNAIKFTPSGGRVRLRVTADDRFVRCAISDTGPGIAPEDHSKLFQPFVQLDNSNTREAGGTGLGLSIVRALVEAHGGEVGVDSDVGQGATFWFTLPVARDGDA